MMNDERGRGKQKTEVGRTGLRCWGLAAKEIVQQRGKIHFKVSGDFAEDLAQGSYAKGLVGRDGDVVLWAPNGRSHTHVAAGLASDLVPVTPQEGSQLGAFEVAGKLQAGMTSSLTR
jgi:hypothetical protein